jgi:hypothetical protein
MATDFNQGPGKSIIVKKSQIQSQFELYFAIIITLSSCLVNNVVGLKSTGETDDEEEEYYTEERETANDTFYSIGFYDEAVKHDENDTKNISEVRRVVVSYVPRFGALAEDHTFILENPTTIKVVYTPPKEFFEAQFRSSLVPISFRSQVVTSMNKYIKARHTTLVEFLKLPFPCEKIDDVNTPQLLVRRDAKVNDEVRTLGVIHICLIEKTVQVKKKIMRKGIAEYVPDPDD